MSGLAGLATLAGAGVNFMSSYINRRNDMALLKYQNEYNSPKNMMKRLLEAGINPNAAAQSIAGSPGYGNMAPADASTVSSLMPNDLGSTIGQSVNNALTADLIKSNIEKNREDTRGQKIQNDYEDATFDARIQQALDSGAITAAEAEKARLYLEKYPEFLDMSLEELRSNIDKTYAETDRINKEIDKIDQDIKESDKRIEKLEQDIKTAKSQEAKNYAEIALTKEKTRNQQLLNDKQEMENNREALTGYATGTVAAYMDIADREGKDAADAWLETNNEIANKVISNSSEAAAQGQQNVVDNTPQGHLKRMYEEQMNKELADIDKRIAAKKRTFGENHNEVRKMMRERDRIIRRYRNRMRRVEKSASVGGSAFGFGLNAGG